MNPSFPFVHGRMEIAQKQAKKQKVTNHIAPYDFYVNYSRAQAY